jgi:hypothetical protein
MSVGILSLTIYLPDCHSLKAKRSRIKPIIARLHKEFNISVVEYDHNDVWQSCQLMIACASREGKHAEATLTRVIKFYESHWPDCPLTNENIEIII